MKVTKKYLTELTFKVIGAAIEVHKHLGPGLLESTYEKCFLRELELRGISFKNQFYVPLNYKGLIVGDDLKLDVLIEDILCVELKTIEEFAPIHEAIILSYMRFLEKPKGVLINFHCTNIFKEGQRTFVNNLYSILPDN